MKLKAILICILIGWSFALQAQDYKVVSMESLPTDMTARKHIVKGPDGGECAVFRIATQNISPEQRESFYFECDMGSYVAQKSIIDGEILVWVSSGLKTLKIRHSKLGRWELHTTNYSISVEPLHTYKIVIQGTMASNTNEKPEVTQQYLAFQISPANAVLEVEGELWEVASDGSAMKFVNFGTYNYRVMAPNHVAQTGTVIVNDPDNTQTVPVNLKPDFVEVTLKVDADAEIWVNNEKKGSRTWTGNLGKGTYKIECKQASHETSVITKEITTDLNGQTINLPKPAPVYGSLNIESTPSFAAIYIDGVMVGESPKFVKEVLVDGHELKLVKEGYVDYLQTITIQKGERKQVSINMEKKEDQPSIAVTNTSADQTYTVNGVSFTMKYVEGGSFEMGATSEQGSDWYGDERPVHSETLSSFFMGETEVTQALWVAVMGGEVSHSVGWTDSFGQGNYHPAYFVSWAEINEFLEKINQQTGMSFRLPTEAEWEYAARGGKKSNNTKYAGSENLSEVGWYGDNSTSTHAVKEKSSNELGLYDMSGNVREWCSNRYYSYDSRSETNSAGPYYGALRGGCWNNLSRRCRVSAREKKAPIDRPDCYSGFRLCLSK